MDERANTEQIKVELAAEIIRLIDERKLTEAAASRQLDVAEGDIVRLRDAQLGDFSIDRLIDILNRFSQRVGVYVTRAPTEVPTDHRPILEKIAEITASVPPEEWEKLPTDLAANHDHYLYGAPKRD
jgi:predicted XRE-type DNA-binding protein